MVIVLQRHTCFGLCPSFRGKRAFTSRHDHRGCATHVWSRKKRARVRRTHYKAERTGGLHQGERQSALRANF